MTVRYIGALVFHGFLYIFDRVVVFSVSVVSYVIYGMSHRSRPANIPRSPISHRSPRRKHTQITHVAQITREQTHSDHLCPKDHQGANILRSPISYRSQGTYRHMCREYPFVGLSRGNSISSHVCVCNTEIQMQYYKHVCKSGVF